MYISLGVINPSVKQQIPILINVPAVLIDLIFAKYFFISVAFPFFMNFSKLFVSFDISFKSIYFLVSIFIFPALSFTVFINPDFFAAFTTELF